VAEGVETEEQRGYVARREVPLAQGWLFAMLMPAGELVNALSEACNSTSVEAMPQHAREPGIWASDGRSDQEAEHGSRL
jgi:EAL domain-containing protein (putative c-di-GMP-specific phosphodiesterase class I)